MDGIKEYSEKSYKEAYSKLGEERVQQGTKGFVEISRNRRLKTIKDAQSELDAKDYEKFWFARRDQNWAEIPMKKVWSRKERKNKYIALITKILVYLAPKSAFNPHVVWTKLKNQKIQLILDEQKELSNLNKKSNLSKIEIMRIENIQKRINDNIIAEVTRIRNSKDSLNELIRYITTKIARDILLVEILKKAVSDKNTTEILDVLWAIESTTLSTQNAPEPKQPSDILKTTRDPTLVYDSYTNVERLIDEAKKSRSKVTDLIKFQLNDMSDRLPPLSPYTFDFKLDDWQVCLGHV